MTQDCFKPTHTVHGDLRKIDSIANVTIQIKIMKNARSVNFGIQHGCS